MSDRGPRLPDVSQPHRYEHRPPRRPSHLPRRLTPPPDRGEPPDLTLFLYAGIVLLVILMILAVPYLIGYLFEVVRF
ncbi:MAG TPA: hypothetical protein VFM03_03240 [Candidatus Limnocylindria bacterium]|nr:hypothetical protein [Candidatus Limnocylindria bacterium]